jgi:arylsulfate sulfotransferase
MTSSVRGLITAGCLIAGATLSGAALAVPVITGPTTSLPSPQPLGTTITINYSATDTDPGTISYRVQIAAAHASTLQMVRDFSVQDSFVYTPVRQEGSYQFVVTARNNSTGNTTTASIPSYTFTTLVVGGEAVLTPTANALVALLSSPPCPASATKIRASILESGQTQPSYTNWEDCPNGKNVNILVGQMMASTNYTIRVQTTNGSTIRQGKPLPFTTGVVPVSVPPITVSSPLVSSDDQDQRFVVLSLIQSTAVAVNLAGQVVWYYPNPGNTYQLLYRTVPGGEMLMLANGPNSNQSTVQNAQVLREIDLAGNTVRETNASRVAEQVVAMSGIQSNCAIGSTECIAGAFHHEAYPLPNGHTLVLVDEEQIFTDGTQGSSPSNPVDVIGDLIIDLDTNWQVAWYWRAFDFLDVNRAAILGEICNATVGGCPPLWLTTGNANDWLHSNALYYRPSDGNITLSMRHQDWVDKIDYSNGTGDGAIMWTLGLDGSFTIDNPTNDPYPWFSHQHDPGFLQNGTTTIALFDNGNTRVAPPPIGLGLPPGTLDGDSRGYVMTVDETTMVATPTLMADIGLYSMALGTAELLDNGDYWFDAGFGSTTPPIAFTPEVFPSGQLSYALQVTGLRCYRAMRMTSLYSPPDKD